MLINESSPTDFEVIAVGKNKELREKTLSTAFQDLWPQYILHEPTGYFVYHASLVDAYLDTIFAVVDRKRPGEVIGRCLSIPFSLGTQPDRCELPDTGWQGLIRWALEDRLVGRPPNALSLLEMTIIPSHRGRGIPWLIIEAVRQHCRAAELGHLVGPVRPVAKHREPLTPMVDYALRTRDEDGLPSDPWLRFHVQAGGRIEKIAPCSMVVAGSLAEWRDWTGESFDESGPTIVPGALNPVHVSISQNHAVYVEPNVWVRHRIPS